MVTNRLQPFQPIISSFPVYTSLEYYGHEIAMKKDGYVGERWDALKTRVDKCGVKQKHTVDSSVNIKSQMGVVFQERSVAEC
jgi:hypothetical protein